MVPYRKFRFALPKPPRAPMQRFTSHRGREIRVISNPFGRKPPAPTRTGFAAWVAALGIFLSIIIDVVRTIARGGA